MSAEKASCVPKPLSITASSRALSSATKQSAFSTRKRANDAWSSAAGATGRTETRARSPPITHQVWSSITHHSREA